MSSSPSCPHFNWNKIRFIATRMFAHTLAVLDKVVAVDQDEPDLALRLAAVLHDVGMPKTRQITPKSAAIGTEFSYARITA